uniref:NACHT domain-containing protein n=1 Tax=Branchiostoma floridae TaxID=7739 RepID=C3YNT5_BRAFL|eukprot:XP_002602033.1 hypothetical protein BRAFLDRAFT_82622 [Branchiostoma floridae]
MALSKPYTPGTARGAKLAALLVDEGTALVRKILEDEIQKMNPPSLREQLMKHKEYLYRNHVFKKQGKNHRANLNPGQKKTLYPPNGMIICNVVTMMIPVCNIPDTAQGFDISLLELLLKVLVWLELGRGAPYSGERDRLRRFRKANYGHISGMELSEDDFNRLWQELTEILVALGGERNKISERLNSIVDPEQEAEYFTLLDQLYKEDMEVKDLARGGSLRQLKKFDPAETIEDLIRNNYTLLRKRLQVEKLIPHFIERRLLDFPEDKQVAMSKTTTPGKAEALLELLIQKGTCTTEEFVEILKKGDHQHVADQLKRTDTHSKTTKVCEDLNLHLGEVYTNPQLQRRDGRERFQDTDTIVSLADIYHTSIGVDSQASSVVRKVRVEGDPGIGKSCSCQKLAYDWASGKLDRFKVVFFLEMRHIAGKVQDEIFEQLLPKDTKNTPDHLWSYIQENEDDVLFILDGLDELSQAAREVTDVVDLIQGKILRNCRVLVTSRPYHCVVDLEKCHQFYKIVGYSRENSEMFIHKYFSSSPESASKLIKELHSNSNLSEIVVNPLNNVLICVVWEDNNNELPSGKDDLYRDIVDSVAKRFCKKRSIAIEGDKLPPHIEEALRGLEKLSWEGLEQEQLQFNIDEITKKYQETADNMLNMGLLTRDYSFSRIKRTYYCAFLHKTFQEYMAARYISGLVMDGSSREQGMKCVCRLFGMSDAIVDNRGMVMSCQRKYKEKFAAGYVSDVHATAMALSKPSSPDPVYTPDSAETIEDLIRKNYTLLRKRLQVEKLIPHFIERKLLDFPEDKQVAMSKTTAPGKAEALLELLTQKGTCTPEEFVEILKKGDHRHVADQLKRTGTHSKTTKGPSDLTDDVIDCLKDLYATEYAHVRPLPWCEDFNLHLGEVFTNLQLQYKDGRGRFQNTETIVSLADIYSTIASEGEDEISQVNVRSDVRKVRVEGDPGIGKSCSCQKLAYDWASGKLDRFKVVFFLEMRHLAGKIKDEIFEQLLPKDAKNTPDQLWSYIQENQDDVLFILDGLDELSQAAREATDVVDLIQGKILRNCHVLVTSRPYHCVKDLEKCHQFYKIVGYSRKNSLVFIHKYFSNSPESASKLINQLYSNRNLSKIIVNPLNNVLICVVWEDNNKNLPSYKDELYRDIVHSVAKRFCKKRDPDMEVEGDQLTPDVEDALRNLGKLSWEGLEQDQLQFNIEEITKKYGTTADNMLNMGLLTRDYSFSRIKRTCYCTFLHKKFQEYMAARYISGLVVDGSSREEGMKCVCRLFGMSDDTVENRELIITCYRKYREVQNWLLLILGENSRPLFEKFAKELSKAQTDEDREVLSCLCILWLGTSCAGGKMAEIVAHCLSQHATNNVYNFDDNKEDLRFYHDDHFNWCVGLAHVLTYQKELPVSHGTSVIQHLTVNCPLVRASQEKLDVLENALSDYDAMRSVTFLGTGIDTCSLRTYIPRCGTESVIIHSKGVVNYLSLLSTLEQLSAVARIEHVTAEFFISIDANPGERHIEFSEFDRLLARMIKRHTRLRSLRLMICCLMTMRKDTKAKIFSNLTATLQSISEHTRLEVVDFKFPGECDLAIIEDASECAENQHETINVEPMVHKLTECVKKNKVLKKLRLRWRSSCIKGNRNKMYVYHGDCSSQALSNLCSAIRENRTLETLVVEGMLSHTECRAEMISELIRNKPSNYKELSITFSNSHAQSLKQGLVLQANDKVTSISYKDRLMYSKQV